MPPSPTTPRGSVVCVCWGSVVACCSVGVVVYEDCGCDIRTGSCLVYAVDSPVDTQLIALLIVRQCC